MTELSKNDFAFYCLDITKAGENGILGALLSRILFSRFLRKYLMKKFDTNKKINLHYITKLLKYFSKFLSTFHIKGPFPLLIGYYNTKNKNLILVSGGLPVYIITEKNKIQLPGTDPLGRSNVDYFDYISEHCHFWQSQVWCSVSSLRLTVSFE